MRGMDPYWLCNRIASVAGSLGAALLAVVGLTIAGLGWAVTAVAVSEPCFVSGGGIISTDSGIDVFGGIAASPKAGSTRGHWEHVTAAGDRLEGDVHFLSCSLHPGLPADPPSTFVNVAELGGSAIWNGQAGYIFDVTVEDHGEPGSLDRYSLEVRDLGGVTVYSVDEPLAGGNIQIHPPNEGHPF